MKKMIAVSLAIGLLLSASGCTPSPADPTAATVTTTGSESAGSEGDTAFERVEISDTELNTRASYSVSDDEAIANRQTVVATVGDATLTNSLLQVYYWMDVYDFLGNYGSYAPYLGLDFDAPLEEQIYDGTGSSWQHFFLDNALYNWHRYQAMALMAEKSGITLDDAAQAELVGLRDSMEQAAIDAGYEDVDAMLQVDLGAGVTFDDHYAYMRIYHLGHAYLNAVYTSASQEITDSMLQTYFSEHEAELAESGITKDSGNYYSVRHIMILAEEDTDAAWEKSREQAQSLLDQWLAEGATEEDFAYLAYQYSQDDGSYEEGGLYEKLTADEELDETYKAWYLDESRQVGDYDLIKSEYGYHVMYFCGSDAQWRLASREGLLSQISQELVTEVAGLYPMEVSYEDIGLGVVEIKETEVAE